MYNKLKGRIIEMFGSQRSFAEAISKSETFVSSRLNGSFGFSRDDIILWAETLKLTIEEIGIYFFAH